MPKILLETIDYIEFDIQYPLYAYIEEDEYEIFVMIDYDFFRRVKLTKFTGMVEISKHRSNNRLAAIWHENKCEKDIWEQCQKQLKNIVSNF